MCLRVFSTVLIVLCHIVRYYTFIPGSGSINQFLNIGVQIFLLISGYLYGAKHVNAVPWLYARAKRVWLPVVIVTAADVAVMAAMNSKTDALTFIMYLFNLHGLLFLNWRFFSKFIQEIPNLGHLWFTTIIMLCYLIVPLLQKASWKKTHSAKKCAASLGVLLAVTILLSAAGIVDLSHFFLFIVGYSLGSFGFAKEQTDTRRVLLFGFAALGMQIIRVVLKLGYPGFRYYATYVSLSHAALGSWIFYAFFLIEKLRPDLIRRLAECKAVVFFDSCSFYIYLVHGLFCMGTAFNVYLKFDTLWVSTALFIVLTAASALALKGLTEMLIKHLPPVNTGKRA